MKRLLTVSIVLVLVLSLGLVVAGHLSTVAAGNGPPVETGLVLRLDASDVGSITRDVGNKVSEWADLSPEGNHATQATHASQPEWVPDVLFAKPVVRFDGATTYMATGAHTPEAAQPNTVFVVWSVSDSTGTEQFATDGLADSNRQIVRWRSAADGVGGYAGSHDLKYDKGIPFGHIVTTVLFDGTNSEIYENGQWKATGNAGAHGYGGLTVGARYSADQFFLDGDIAEILIYSRALSNEERQEVEQYLAAKWLEAPEEVWVCAADGDDSNPGTDDYPFATIQKGIDVVAVGGTINVKPGIYGGHVSIANKPLTLQSTQGAAETTITGLVNIDLDDGQTVVFGGAEDAGFTVDRGNPIPDSGILLSAHNGAEVTISHNIITGEDVGIRSEAATISGSTVTIEHNVITGCPGHGISLSVIEDSDVYIKNNVIADNGGDGIYLGLVNASDISIQSNIIGGDTPDDGNGGAGIHIYEILSNSTVTIGGDSEDDGNTISQNGLGVPMTGIHIEWVYASDVTIENNAITDNQGSGICIENIGLTMGTVTIARNIIAENGKYGIDIGQIYLSTLVIDQNKVGAWEDWKGNDWGGINVGQVRNASNVQITANHANKNCAHEFGVQIGVIRHSQVNIEDNEANGNVNGIIVHDVQEGGALSVVGNTIAENKYGLVVWGIQDATLVILGNVIEYNEDGVVIGNVANSAAHINFNNIFDNQEWGLHNGSANEVEATHNWWGSASGPSGQAPGEGDAVSANVLYDPWLGAAMTAQPTGCTADRGYGVDAQASTANISAKATEGDETTTVTVAEYVGNPTGVGPGLAAGPFFFDVHVGGTLPSQLVVTIDCDGDCSGIVLRWFDIEDWHDVDPVSYTNGTIVATLSDTSSPTIAQLTGTPFAAGSPDGPPVGGTAEPASRLALLAPWLVLGAAIIAGATMLASRRQAQS